MTRIALTLLALVTAGGCFGGLKVAPVTVEPIHMTIDVNLHDQREPAKPPAAPPSR